MTEIKPDISAELREVKRISLPGQLQCFCFDMATATAVSPTHANRVERENPPIILGGKESVEAQACGKSQAHVGEARKWDRGGVFRYSEVYKLTFGKSLFKPNNNPGGSKVLTRSKSDTVSYFNKVKDLEASGCVSKLWAFLDGFKSKPKENNLPGGVPLYLRQTIWKQTSSKVWDKQL